MAAEAAMAKEEAGGSGQWRCLAQGEAATVSERYSIWIGKKPRVLPIMRSGKLTNIPCIINTTFFRLQ